MVNAPLKVARIDLTDLDFVAIKVPMFSFTRLAGADPVLRVEMASTGEVACFGSRPLETYMKGLISSGFRIPTKAILLSIGHLQAKVEFLPAAELLIKLGYKLYATQGTAEFLKANKVEATLARKPSSSRPMSPGTTTVNGSVVSAVAAAVNGLKDGGVDCIEALKRNDIDLVINIPSSQDVNDLTDGYTIRRTAVDFNISLLTNIKGAVLFVDALEMIKEKDFKYECRSWDDYLREATLL
jgi:carbamoyl-phosphate synthase large subunit